MDPIVRIVFITTIALSCSTQREEIRSHVIDLASDTDWELSIDDGPWRIIRVPGGGYNSDLQEPPFIDQEDVVEKITYRRCITIPANAENQAIGLAFGAVNHGCEIYLDDRLISEQVRPLMPFEVDITGHVEPGKTYELDVVTHPQWYYDYNVPHAFVYTEARNHPNSRPDFSSESGWATKFSYGITRYVELRVRPAIHIKDIFVRTSVSNNSLSFDLWIHNRTPEDQELLVVSEISPWNEAPWEYPEIEPLEISVGAWEDQKVTIGPIMWGLGPESYWWPNKPFREDYLAVLHNLHIRVSGESNLNYEKTRRFGFVEWAEESNYYSVNGVRINMISDGTPEPAMSEYDCYSRSPAFLPPTDTTLGCPETWKRYMRLGICANRTHQSTPTEYMMDVADELGFILVAESPIRGCQKQLWTHMDPYLNSVKDMATYGRNHPSICRYSLLNEGTTQYIPELIDAIATTDDTRPLVFEDNSLDQPAIFHGNDRHAYAMLHYVDYPKPAKMITGMGEYAWHWADRSKFGPVAPGSEGGMEEFIYYGGDMRRWDIVYFAGWNFINYWPNFLEGMSHEKHAWKQSAYQKDREDGVDGWDSPLIDLMQKYFHPYLVLDHGIHEMNDPDSDPATWPEYVPTYRAGEAIKRNLEIFNDGLMGNDFDLKWEVRLDSPEGKMVDKGVISHINIEPGFHKKVEIEFSAPQPDKETMELFVDFKLELDGVIVFIENEVHFNIIN